MYGMEKEIVYITLGCGNKFDISKFNAPQNIPHFCKPEGGLWGSPVGSKWGWKEWVESEMPEWMETKYGLSEFRFRFNSKARLYVIDSPFDLLTVPYKVKGGEYAICFEDLIDFERMARDYDAILLTELGERRTRFSDREYGMSLYGWDCESILVLRPENIEVI